MHFSYHLIFSVTRMNVWPPLAISGRAAQLSVAGYVVSSLFRILGHRIICGFLKVVLLWVNLLVIIIEHELSWHFRLLIAATPL